jgi:PII-like signaling protein
MIKTGPAKKLSIYIDETDKLHGKPVYEVLLDFFFKNKIAGASVFRGVAGYGSTGKMHTSKILELSTTLPLKIEVIETEEVISAVLPKVSSLMEKGLIEVSDTMVVTYGKKPHHPPG